jgi:hydrogenase expression/formation protein HypC
VCLGIPGRIEAITRPDAKLALVDVLGVKREVNIACIVREGEPLDACIGAWVLVHVGFAMNRVDEREARLTLELLRELGEAQEQIEAMRSSPGASTQPRTGHAAAPRPADQPGQPEQAPT